MDITAKAHDVRFITRKVFFDSDTTTIRLILAMASLGWALVLLGNLALGMAVLDRPAYALMRVIGGEYLWSALFGMHFVGVTWRLYDPVPRPTWALAINSLGFAVWTVSTIFMALSVGFVPPGTALEMTMCVASAWALYRTDLKPEMVSP